MTYPEYKDLADALLCLIFRNGNKITPKETYEPLAVYFCLSEKERNQTRHDGRNGKEWENKIQWTRQRLINQGLLDGKKRGIWQLSDDGINRAKTIFHKYIF